MSGPTAHILVDASVAKSVSDPARHPTSVACLALIRQLEKKDCATGAAMTPALQAEWKRQASRLMVSWLAGMELRGRVRHERDRNVSDLRSAVAQVEDAGIRAALEKDLHLSEAAVFHGLPVASHDNKQRRFLGKLVPAYSTVGRVQWFSPVSDHVGDWQPWVQAGCGDAEAFRVSAA